MLQFQLPIPFSDIAGFCWLVALWVSYTLYTDRGRPREHSLRAAMHRHRVRWLTQLLRRENRMMDMQILGHWGQGASFFASTSILILVGLFSLLGASDAAMTMLNRIPFAERMTPEQWEFRLLVLIVIFVYAFFKFTWGLRQFNYCSVLIGAAAGPGSEDGEFVRRTAWLCTLASKDFNQGLRAYYFGLAVLAWFVNVVAFVAVTALTLGVLYWREFHSTALRTLERSGEMIDRHDDGVS